MNLLPVSVASKSSFSFRVLKYMPGSEQIKRCYGNRKLWETCLATMRCPSLMFSYSIAIENTVLSILEPELAMSKKYALFITVLTNINWPKLAHSSDQTFLTSRSMM